MNRSRVSSELQTIHLSTMTIKPSTHITSSLLTLTIILYISNATMTSTQSPRHNPSTPPPTGPNTNPNSNLHRSYGYAPATNVSLGLAARHKLHCAATADYYFRLGHYSDCAAVCEAILASDPLPAEAIRARCHSKFRSISIRRRGRVGRAGDAV